MEDTKEESRKPAYIGERKNRTFMATDEKWGPILMSKDEKTFSKKVACVLNTGRTTW